MKTYRLYYWIYVVCCYNHMDLHGQVWLMHGRLCMSLEVGIHRRRNSHVSNWKSFTAEGLRLSGTYVFSTKTDKATLGVTKGTFRHWLGRLEYLKEKWHDNNGPVQLKSRSYQILLIGNYENISIWSKLNLDKRVGDHHWYNHFFKMIFECHGNCKTTIKHFRRVSPFYIRIGHKKLHFLQICVKRTTINGTYQSQERHCNTIESEMRWSKMTCSSGQFILFRYKS